MFLTHDAIARGIFNKHWSSGTGGLLAWSAELTNLEDNSLVPLWRSLVYFWLFQKKLWIACTRVGCILNLM